MNVTTTRAHTPQELARARATGRLYAKEVHISTADYRNRSGGYEPRGYGAWIFLPEHAAKDQDQAGQPLDRREADAQRYALAINIRGTYAAARKEAAHIAASQGCRNLTVQP